MRLGTDSVCAPDRPVQATRMKIVAEIFLVKTGLRYSAVGTEQWKTGELEERRGETAYPPATTLTISRRSPSWSWVDAKADLNTTSPFRSTAT